MMENALLIILLDVILLVFLLMMSIPLPVCFLGALMFLSAFGNVSMKTMLVWVFSQSTGTVLLASPLFILAGTYMGGSGIAKRLLDCADSFIGHIKSGLGTVAIVVCAVMGAISGSGFTGVAATGPIMIPRMEEQGYERGYATALVTVSSVLGLLIPPSVVMIMFGWVTETSILACFLSTLGPGLLITALFIVIHVIWSKKFDLKVLEKKPVDEYLKNAGSKTFKAIPALIMPLIILGGIYGGVFTATEAAAVSSISAIPVGIWVYKACTIKGFLQMTKEASSTIGSIMVMIVCCLMLSRVFTIYRVPSLVLDLLMGITTNKYLLLFIIDIFLFLVGMIVNDTTGVLICAPLLMPVMTQLGVSPVHFAAIMGVNLAMGGVTPPYASILYLGMRIGKAEFHEILKPTMTFLILGYVPVVFLTTYIPDLALAIPRMCGFSV